MTDTKREAPASPEKRAAALEIVLRSEGNMSPQAQRTLASWRANRARPAVSWTLCAHTAAVKRQMNRPDQQERSLAAQARR